MRYVGGELVTIRGSSETISAVTNSNAYELLMKAVEKHLACNRNLPVVDYVLLYPDGGLVDKLPASTNDFTVFEYKKFLKKPYQKLKLFLCPKDEYESCE